MQVLTERVEPGAAMIRTDAAGKQNVIRRPNSLCLPFESTHAQPRLRVAPLKQLCHQRAAAKRENYSMFFVLLLILK